MPVNISQITLIHRKNYPLVYLQFLHGGNKSTILTVLIVCLHLLTNLNQQFRLLTITNDKITFMTIIVVVINLTSLAV